MEFKIEPFKSTEDERQVKRALAKDEVEARVMWLVPVRPDEAE